MRPIWFGPEEQPRFGVLHEPAEARAGVVLCLSVGDEAFPGFRAYRRLAHRLEEAGVAVLRFDYGGTGDSAGTTDDIGGVEAWIGDVQAAISVVRSLEVGPVGVVGMRFGAILARHAAAREGADGLVLWDPYLSGRRFLREQLARGIASGTAAMTEPGSERVELPGITFPRYLNDEIAALDLAAEGGGFPPAVLALHRPGAREQLEPLLGETPVEWEVNDDHDRFYANDARIPFLPEALMEAVVRWSAQSLAAVRRSARAGVTEARYWSGPATIAVPPGGGVVEQAVEVGENRLFAIVSEPAGGAPSGPPVLLLNAGLDRHVGPSRLWVDLARRWASDGVARVMRLDVRSLGESPLPPPGTRETSYPPGAVDDVTAAARFLAPTAPASVRLAGLCSGGYHAAEAAAELGSQAAVLLNPAVPQHSLLTEISGPDGPAPPGRAARRSTPLALRLSRDERAVALAHRLLPRPAWWLLDRLGIYGYPSRPYEQLVRAGTELRLFCGPPDAAKLLGTGAALVRRLERGGRFRLAILDLDHNMRKASAREALVAQVLPTVAGLAPSGRPAPAGAAEKGQTEAAPTDSAR